MKTEPVSKQVSGWGAWVRTILIGVGVLLSPFTDFHLPRVVAAAPCTPGVNCYCDRVRSGDLFDPNLLLCEDFEAPTLIRNQGFGNGAPYYGPWYDHTGYSGCARGANSYWTKVYNNGPQAGLWLQNRPTNPALGCSCSYPMCFQSAWDAADRWQGNTQSASGGATIAIMQDADFSVEIPTITKPTGRAGGGSGAFDGAASLAHRVVAGSGSDIAGSADFRTTVRTFGITMAVAYPNNSQASGIWAQPWKHNEWHSVAMGGGGGDGLFLFHNGTGVSSQRPFAAMFTFSMGDSTSSCQAKVNAATKTAGDFECDAGGNFLFRADRSLYSQSADWPLGTWGCVRGYYRNMGLANSAIQIWLTGPAGVEKKIIDISNMDLRQQSAKSGYDALIWNAYANTNQGDPGTTRTNQTTFRYEDNIHVRTGAPVSCAQIGSSGNPQTAPTAPSGLIVR